MKTVFTDKQLLFLDALYGEAEGDIRKAMTIAGYAKTTPPSAVVDMLADEIVERGRKFLALNIPKVAMGIINVHDDPTQLGAEKKIMAAKEVMDRAGLVKREKVDVSGDGISGIFFLPAKKSD